MPDKEREREREKKKKKKKKKKEDRKKWRKLYLVFLSQPRTHLQNEI